MLDAPEAERAAREAFDEALEEFLAEGEEAHEETVAAYGVDGLRAMVAGVHAELRSRGVAEPRLPEPPQPDPAAAIAHAAEAAAETLEELKPERPQAGAARASAGRARRQRSGRRRSTSWPRCGPPARRRA